MPCQTIQLVDTGHQQDFNFVLCTSDSVCHSFDFVFDRIRSVLTSANDNFAQLPEEPPGLVFLHHPVVLSPVVLSHADFFTAYLAVNVLAA
jgi:hypothetical protein